MSSQPKIGAAPRTSATTEKATELEHVRSEKSTIALSDSDLEPQGDRESVASKIPFSIRRGIVLGGRFRVKELIGAGAQCYVYSAEHTTLKSPVAIKCLQPELVTADLVERFAREAQALTAIQNPHVAAVLDVGRAPCGTPFIVMEYLQGRDLAALLETRPRLEPRQATEILLQTCEGLAAAHALGLVHQDIKPSNIFLSDQMGIVKAKLVDFGVARVAPEQTRSLHPRFRRSELDDTVGGTPFYMPPEQYFGRGLIDPRSDIFSLGMVLYEMLRGTHAFDLEMDTRKPGEPVHIEHAGIDPALVAVIERCLEQQMEARFDSVAELAVALLPFAPSRSRAHVDAALALLRKAGIEVGPGTISSRPPPMMPPADASNVPTLAPPPPEPSEAPSVSSLPVPATSSRWPLYAGVGVVLALAASASGLELARRRAAKPLTTTSAPAVAAPQEPAPTLPSKAIAIHPTVRATPAAASAGVVEIMPPVASASVRAAKSSAGRRAKAAMTRDATVDDVADPKAPEPSPTGTSEDLGF